MSLAGKLDDSDLKSGERMIAVMDRTGDTRIIWNPNNQDEVDNAKKQFSELTRDKKFQAYRVDHKGDKGQQIRDFDPSAERMILVPPMVGG